MKLNMSLRQKIVAIGVSQLAIVSVVLFVLYYNDTKEKVQSSYIERARSVILTAEATRENMGGKWDKGIFNARQMREWADKNEMDKVLAAVPVVTAWQAGMAKAKEGGYEFKVPKFHPRNPKNEPDEIEAEALRALEKGDLAEYHVVDRKTNKIRYFRPVKLTQECLLCHGDPATSASLWGNEKGLDPTGAKMENWKVGEVHGAFEILQSLDAADAQVASSLTWGAFIVGGLVLASAGILFWLITRSVIRPVKDMVSVSQSIAAGDLTKSCVSTSTDEIGQLAGALEGMRLNLKTVVSDISEKSGYLGSAAQQLCQTADQLASGAAETTLQSGTVAAAAEEMSVNMSNMAASTQEMSSNVQTVSSAVEEMTASISEVARSAEKTASSANDAREHAEEGNKSVAPLDAAATEIGKVINVIQDVAEQTNLLALNATIEAARAGEAGKGFAVVADEVKALARQTAQATEDIRRRIEEMQRSTSLAVSAIGSVGEVIRRADEESRTIAAAVEEQSIATKEIARNVAETATAAEVVARTVTESASASQEITRSIAAVDEAARRTAQGASEAQASGQNLAAVAEQLRTLVGQFRV